MGLVFGQPAITHFAISELAFDEACAKHGIKHKLTQFRHPWTNGQVEVMNKKIKAHTTKLYHYETADSLRKHLMAFMLAYNFQRPLKANTL